jgi:N-acetylmuramoyl-L-alanine amidase
MKITADHWLDGVRRQLIPGGSAMPIRRALVIHFTAGASGQSSIDFWRTPDAKGACAHVVIERDGRVSQCRPFNLTCGHAGKSQWKDPKTGAAYEGLNSCTIGIELANAGNDPGALSWAKKQPGFASVRATHRNGGTNAEWECYPGLQLASLTEVAESLVKHYKLDDVTGHDCIAPARKDDPGPAFDMLLFRKALGFKGLPAVHN